MSVCTEEQRKLANARLGSLLRDRWKIDGLLGVGGMAAVYRATHRNGKRVAIKILHADVSADTELRGRFLREGYLANKVDHPGTVSVLDDDVTEAGEAFLVMDLLEGETIDALWRKNGAKLPPDQILSLAYYVLDVLAAAHDKGIVHRDVKPDNLFLTEEQQVKVLDFGVARLNERAQRSTTRSGVTLGTPSFMPPEQARARWDEVDHRTDIWAMGATMFSLLTGRYVHDESTPNEMLLAAMSNPAPPLLTVDPTAPGHLAVVIDRALAYDKNDRWPDARSMQEAVSQAHSSVVTLPADSTAVGMMLSPFADEDP
jgi:eukaryotic-like serine/threonine-protein kinase